MGFLFPQNKIVLVLLCCSLCLTLCDPGTVAHQAPLSMGFSRQEHWSGLPGPPPGDLPNPGIKPKFPTFPTESLPPEPPGKLTDINIPWAQSMTLSQRGGAGCLHRM